MFHLIYPTTCGARGHFSSINLKQQGSNIWHKIKKSSGEHVYKIVYNLCGGKYSGENFSWLLPGCRVFVYTPARYNTVTLHIKVHLPPPCVYKADSNPKPSQKTGHESRTGV